MPRNIIQYHQQKHETGKGHNFVIQWGFISRPVADMLQASNYLNIDVPFKVRDVNILVCLDHIYMSQAYDMFKDLDIVNILA